MSSLCTPSASRSTCHSSADWTFCSRERVLRWRVEKELVGEVRAARMADSESERREGSGGWSVGGFSVCSSWEAVVEGGNSGGTTGRGWVMACQAAFWALSLDGVSDEPARGLTDANCTSQSWLRARQSARRSARSAGSAGAPLERAAPARLPGRTSPKTRTVGQSL